MKVIYPVLFYEEKEGGYSAFVPDLQNELNINASTCGDSLENIMEMAEDLIAGIVLDEMEDGNKIPKPSKIQDINFENFESKIDIEDWNYISKWINTKAEELKINFSKTLEEALLKEIYEKK